MHALWITSRFIRSLRTRKQEADYKNPDGDDRGPWRRKTCRQQALFRWAVHAIVAQKANDSILRQTGIGA